MTMYSLLIAQEAQGEVDYGISISQTCYRMHQYNVTTSCPTYEAIMAVFPDTSNQDVSGKFIYKDGQLQRGFPQMKNSYRWYDYENSTFLFVDPSGAMKSKLNMITIESSLPEYKLNYKMTNNTRTLGQHRYIDDCNNAVIDGKQWLFLLGDTMNYMKNGCMGETAVNDTKTYYQEYTVHDISTSSKWLHQVFLDWVVENCLSKYDIC